MLMPLRVVMVMMTTMTRMMTMMMLVDIGQQESRMASLARSGWTHLAGNPRRPRMYTDSDRRRSPRLTVAVPVHVLWLDQNRIGHDAYGQVTEVNCQGALLYLLYLDQSLAPGQLLRLVNQTNDAKATARVVWSGEVMPDKSACMGIETDTPVTNEFWGPMAVRLWEELEGAARPGWFRRAGAWLRQWLR